MSHSDDRPCPVPLYGVVVAEGIPSVAALVDDQVILLGPATRRANHAITSLMFADSLLPLLAAGRETWEQLFDFVDGLLASDLGVRWADLRSCRDVEVLAPFAIADYVDFYASRSHAENVTAIFRPGQPLLQPNWLRLPVAYHGRASTVVASGSPIVRPVGQRGLGDDDLVDVGPSRKLDIEAELGWVVGGAPTTDGVRVAARDLRERIFGAVLVNDWSARDLQRWETVPLGPFLGKSFATSFSRWVVPLRALEGSRTDPPPREVPVSEYLRSEEKWAFDIVFEVRLNGHLISAPTFKDMYWTVDQMLAHLTVNGAAVRPGDLFASGTVSGWQPDQFGSLLELTLDGEQALELASGETRCYLEDGDTVLITATAVNADGDRVAFGDVEGTIRPALPL